MNKIETGYHYIFGNMGHGYATPSIGYGFGIMVSESVTEKKADEGGRMVTGLSVGYRF